MQEYAEEKTTKAATKKKKRIRQSWRRRRMSRNGRGEKRRIAEPPVAYPSGDRSMEIR